jgi:hypothetical protein
MAGILPEDISEEERAWESLEVDGRVPFGWMSYTGCGRKKSPIWEANKLKTKEDTANVFFYFWKVHRMPFYINVF